MSEAQPTVYGAYWCPDCRRTKQFLGEHQIPYRWVDIEQDPAGEQFVLAQNDGRRIIPTVVFADGSSLTEPTNAALAAKLKLKTKASRSHYQVVIIGGGPAGLTAALYLAREGIEPLVIERAAFGGQAAGTEKLDNLPGFPEGIAGSEFAVRLRQQAERFGVELLQAQDVLRVHRHANYLCVDTANGDEHSAFAVLIATGSHYKSLGAPGESKYIGAGVHFCATCDGPFYKGKHVAVVGGGNSAAEESLHLTKFADQVTVLVRADRFKASKVIQEAVVGDPKIAVRYHTTVEAFIGASAKLNRLRIRNTATDESTDLPVDGAFIFIGQEPNVGFLQDTPVMRNQWGFIVTGHALVHDTQRPAGFERREPMLLETSIPGLFAAGDVRAGSTKQVASATGEGATAALLIREYLKRV